MTWMREPNADGSLSWVWGWSADFLRQFGPKAKADLPEQLIHKVIERKI